jgi:hypothetical protein
MVGLFDGDLTITFKNKNTNKEETKCQTGATNI